MQELLNIVTTSEYPISGRELHARLGIETRYNDWFRRMCEYGFEEGKDFNLDKKVRLQTEGSRDVSREVIDHMLTLSMAKELCMLQRTETGREVRRYLIGVENAWNSPETVMARALGIANARLQSLTQDVYRLSEKVMQDAPKVLFADSVSASHTDILVGDLAKILRQNGSPMGQNRLFEAMRRDGFLISRKGPSYNLPMQKSMEMGLMRIRESTITNPDGRSTVAKTTRITGKGQVYFVNRYAPCKQPALPPDLQYDIELRSGNP